jgi:hypothetical protein
MEADLNYYRRRLAEEAAAAESAEHQAVRSTHLELARRYDDRIASLEAEHRRTEIRLVTAA